MRRIELLQNTVGALLHLGLGPPLGLVETLLPGAGPLALGQGEVLLAAVEPLRGVEEEVVLRDLRGDVQEGLELGNTKREAKKSDEESSHLQRRGRLQFLER